jgi:rubrerythrin
MSAYDEVSEQEAYHRVLEYQRKLVHEQDEELAELGAEIENIKEFLKKASKDTSKSEIVGYCKECKHPLTNTEIKEEPVCPHCRETTKYTPITEKDE